MKNTDMNYEQLYVLAEQFENIYEQYNQLADQVSIATFHISISIDQVLNIRTTPFRNERMSMLNK